MLSESMNMGNFARHRASRLGARLFGVLLLAQALCSSIGWAQVNSSGLQTDAQFNSSTSTYNITGGTRAGANLFHSFFQFSVGPGETANFSNTTGQGVTNILGRVT